MQVSDGDGGTSATQTRSIDVTPVNDAPVLTNGSNASYGEDSGTTPFLTATLTDIDSADFNGGTLTFGITSGGDGTDVLRLVILNGVTVSGSNVYVDGVLVGTYSGGTSGTDYTINLNSDATPARVQTLFQNLIIVSTGDNPTTGVRNLEVTVTDGDGGTSNTVTATADLNAVSNDDPYNNGSLPTDIAVTEDVLSNLDLSEWHRCVDPRGEPDGPECLSGYGRKCHLPAWHRSYQRFCGRHHSGGYHG
jgi:hypothetical protein